MKKLFTVLALVSVIVSCNSKKKDEKKETTTDTTTTTTNNTTPTDNTTTTPTDNTSTVNAEIPKFADPEVQKFVNEYSAMLIEWKNKPTDAAIAQKWAAKSQEWNTTMTTLGTRIMNDPTEAKKWADWSMWINAKMNPTNK